VQNPEVDADSFDTYFEAWDITQTPWSDGPQCTLVLDSRQGAYL
jgi:hypothetical protein